MNNIGDQTLIVPNDSSNPLTFLKGDEVGTNDSGAKSAHIVTIFSGLDAPFTVDLMSFSKPVVTFGRNENNDIQLKPMIVSGSHGCFSYENGVWKIKDLGSTNGLVYNNSKISSRDICDGDFIRIDSQQVALASGVLFIFSASSSDALWSTLPIGNNTKITIGRDPSSMIRLPHISVSNRHAMIYKVGEKWFISDYGSTNGVVVNGKRISGKVELQQKDIIVITNSKLIFTTAAISYRCFTSGITVDTAEIVIKRDKGKKVTCDHVSLDIKPGELVAVIGGSGAGKSTILNCMCGYLPPAEGEVYINGVDLYRNFNALKKLIGYVPQADIVYDNLTLYDMLEYTAKMRLPADVSPEERKKAIDKAIATVEMTAHKDRFIKNFSGGQKKRASIAVELLSDPNLLFLDEPSSGLDPGTERSLMRSLRKMANDGKTIVLVTHSTLQLRLCDKVVFMGNGGKLCFCGHYDQALRFFGVRDIVDIYPMITDHADDWKERFASLRQKSQKHIQDNGLMETKNKANSSKLSVLCARYAKLIFNDKQKLLMLLGQAPLLALLISIVGKGRSTFTTETVDGVKNVQSLFFALACCAFWIGMLNAIQEICKERSILKREYMTGLSLNSYLASKVIILGSMAFVQSLLVTAVFVLRLGTPASGAFLPSVVEIFITFYLSTLSATALGLFVSSLFDNPDKATVVAPILLMPQMLFSGIVFKLEGALKYVSYIINCRWGMQGFGCTADVTSRVEKAVDAELENTITEIESVVSQSGYNLGDGVKDIINDSGNQYITAYKDKMIAEKINDASMFDSPVFDLLVSWVVMIGITAAFLFLARKALQKLGKK